MSDSTHTENRSTSVLFADVSGSTKLYETAGDAAAHAAIDSCLDALRKAVESAGGRVVKTIGDEVMALYATPDAAAGSAAAMHAAMEALPEVGGMRLGVRIAFHCGPVIQKDGDVFGDTVNLAARLVEHSQKGQILTSQETADALGLMFRAWTRKLYPIPVKGKAEEVGLCELVWKADGDATQMARPRTTTLPARTPIKLAYRGTELTRRRDNDAVVLGREEGCGVTVATQTASRRHCTVERRADKWILRDHSTNGTYVTVEGDSEVLLRREEFTLRKHGWISLGQPLTKGEDGEPDAVEYSCG
jgi:adenylate cyclase